MRRQHYIKAGTCLTLLIFTILIEYSRSQCLSQDCKINLPKLQNKAMTQKQKETFIDSQVRRIYWQYIRGSLKIYQASVEVVNKQMVQFLIYKSIYGTFFTVVELKEEKNQIYINTFVKLDDGYPSNDLLLTKRQSPFQPLKFYIKLEKGEVLIELDQRSIEQISRRIEQSSEENKQDLITNLIAIHNKIQLQLKQQKIDNHIRKKYPQWLNEAFLINQYSLMSRQKVYSVMTYISQVGTFMVYASFDDKNDIQINNFVKVSDQKLSMKPIIIQPKSPN